MKVILEPGNPNLRELQIAAAGLRILVTRPVPGLFAGCKLAAAPKVGEPLRIRMSFRGRPIVTDRKVKAIDKGSISPITGKRLSQAEVDRMWEAYSNGASLNGVGKLFGRTRNAVRCIFESRGLAMRETVHTRTAREWPRDEAGRMLPKTRHSEEEISAMIASATKIAVPKRLKWEWREWPRERRADFLHRLRSRLADGTERPCTPFSSNVRPFDYTTEWAHEICKRYDAAKGNRSNGLRVRLASEGVEWRGELWFWSPKIGYTRGPWDPVTGRPPLHHVMWVEANGRPVPDAHVVYFLDGNENNLVPENLALKTRNELLRENQAGGLLKRSREHTGLLLQLATERDHADANTEIATELAKAS